MEEILQQRILISKWFKVRDRDRDLIPLKLRKGHQQRAFELPTWRDHTWQVSIS